MNVRTTNWRERFFRYAPLLLWIGLIFFLSTAQGAMTNTSRFIRPLLEWLFPHASEEFLILIHGSIRKFAHFAEYAVLAGLASRAFWSSSVKPVRELWYLFALLLTAFTASIDEYNQSLSTLRTGTASDVLLDCAGGIAAIALCFLYRVRMNTAQGSTAEI